MKIFNEKTICLMLVAFLFASSTVTALKINSESNDDKSIVDLTQNGIFETTDVNSDDIDPLIDLQVTVTIKEIRAFDKIDIFSNPDFYVKVFINNQEFKSSTWRNKNYVTEEWSVTADVPDNEENVSIKIQLWDDDPILDKLCDLSDNNDYYPSSYDVDLVYSLKTGNWRGDDYIGDSSGYGRLNGCDDNSVYQKDRDCELLFEITQNDYDADGIPYWTEVIFFGTDPAVNDTGRDDDSDGIPIEWEWKWGYRLSWNWSNETISQSWIYDPFKWEDHKNLDRDRDGLQNFEEYLTSQWGSDPFRKDIFLELDQMEIGPNGEGDFVPELSKEILRDSYGKHNIVFLVDDGSMGGGEIIPFDDDVDLEEKRDIYYNYFLHGDYDNWRQGVFHYSVIVWNSTEHVGFCFWGGDQDYPYTDSFLLSSKYHEKKARQLLLLNMVFSGNFNKTYRRAFVYAGVMMHETGHTLGIFNSNTPGCDDTKGYYPWQPNWWKWRNYKSCMNYAFVYLMVDYSDGSNGKNDFDDWARIDLTLFQG